MSLLPSAERVRHLCPEGAYHLLKEAGVAVLPGTAFGANGEGYLRLCFANSMENLHEALARMERALGKLKKHHGDTEDTGKG